MVSAFPSSSAGPIYSAGTIDMSRLRYRLIVGDWDMTDLCQVQWEELTDEFASRARLVFHDTLDRQTNQWLRDLFLSRRTDEGESPVPRNRMPIAVFADWGEGYELVWYGEHWGFTYQPTARAEQAARLEITAYDPLRLLVASKDSISWPARVPANTILTDICNTFEDGVGGHMPILNGVIDKPAVALWSQTFLNTSYAEMIASVIRAVFLRGGGRWRARYDWRLSDPDPSEQRKRGPIYKHGIRFVEPGDNIINRRPVYRFDSSNVEQFPSHQENFDSLVTRVQVVAGETRVLYGGDTPSIVPAIRTVDTELVKQFGVLQEILMVTSDQNLSQFMYGTDFFESMAKIYLNEKGVPEQVMRFTAPDLPFLRRYDAVYCDFATFRGLRFIDSITHNANERTMEISLVTNYALPFADVALPEPEPSSTPQQTDEQTTNKNRTATIKRQVFDTLKANGLGSEIDKADQIIQCESGWNPNADGYDTNGYRSRGLWQINDQWYGTWWAAYGWNWADPVDNTKAAIKIYRQFGNSWRAWSCARTLGFA